MELISRLRCGPLKDGIEQKPQALSQPSATLRYAQGLVDAGRGKFNRSNSGTLAFLVKETETPNPATRLTSGKTSCNSLPYLSAKQPVTTISLSSFLNSSRLKIVSMDSSLASSIKAQVFTTIKSALAKSSVASIPSESNDPANFSESTSFFGHPRVTR